ncbi:MAG: type II toxin-antitoxin system VapC family toxin [Acidobacteriota bacterium]
MILPDVNVLVHAYNTDFPDHLLAKSWWEQSVSEDAPIGLCWAVILGFVRITTSRQILTHPLRVAEATGVVRSWLDQPSIRIAHPGNQHAEVLFQLLENAGAGANLTTDAHLAALALEYRAEVATTDADFARFKGVRYFNPMSGKPRRG